MPPRLYLPLGPYHWLPTNVTPTEPSVENPIEARPHFCHHYLGSFLGLDFKNAKVILKTSSSTLTDLGPKSEKSLRKML